MSTVCTIYHTFQPLTVTLIKLYDHLDDTIKRDAGIKKKKINQYLHLKNNPMILRYKDIETKGFCRIHDKVVRTYMWCCS